MRSYNAFSFTMLFFISTLKIALLNQIVKIKLPREYSGPVQSVNQASHTFANPVFGQVAHEVSSGV